MSQLCYKYNPNHVVIGSDFNVDFSQNSANTRMLQDFITDLNLFTSIDLSDAEVNSTFINYDSCTFRIDHFLLSESIRITVQSQIVMFVSFMSTELFNKCDVNYVLQCKL